MRSFFARLLPPRPLVLPAVVSGVLVTLSFPVVSFDWLIFVALVPILAAVHIARPQRRDAYKAGFLLGATTYLSMLWWIVKLIPSADVTIPWLMTPALVLLVLYLAIYPAFFFLLAGVLARYRFVASLFVSVSLWTLFEVIRARGELAFPWGSLGYALSDTPSLIQLAAVGGVPILTFLIMAANFLFSGVFSQRGFPRVVCGVAGVAVVAFMWGQGRAAMSGFDPPDAPPLRVAVIQPDVDLVVKWKVEFRDSTLNLIERLAFEAAGQEAELIVFPETSAPVYIEANAVYKPTLKVLAKTIGIPIFIGFLDHRYDGPDKQVNIYNSSGVFRADGELQKYDKIHLLPFGEALPGSKRFRALRRINFGQANFQPGPAREPLDTGPVKITPLICFESVFPDLCARGVEDGSQLFVNITNDGWFGRTPGPYQHAQMCILRAVEFRRYLLRSANTGVSMIVAPTGEVVGKIGLYEEGMIVSDITPISILTFYARNGDRMVVIASVLLALVGWWLGSRTTEPVKRRGVL